MFCFNYVHCHLLPIYQEGSKRASACAMKRRQCSIRQVPYWVSDTKDLRPKSLCLDSLAPDFTYLPVTRANPHSSLFTHLHYPRPRPNIFEWLRQNSACLRNLLWLATPWLCCLKWCSGFWTSADNGRQEQRGLSGRTFTSIRLERACRSKRGQRGQLRWKTCGSLWRFLPTVLG